MVDKLVRIGFGLVLCVLAKGDIYCPMEERDAVPRFNILCDSGTPCNNINIYCPKSAYTDLLWLDCKGAHACSNITVFSTVPTRVRCRSRSGACENVNVHCGDDVSAALPASASSLFTTSDQGNQEVRPVSCKFRHMDSYVTRNSFFGCYGDVKSCVSLAASDNAYTDSRMRCETTDTPCVMQCLTGRSCLDNEMHCAATDQSLCQCQTDSNCGTVETVDVRATTSDVDSAIETTEESEPTEIEAASSSTTQVVQSSTSTSATDSTTATDSTAATDSTTATDSTSATDSASTKAEATETTSSAIASTTRVLSTQQEQTSSTSATSSTVESTSTSTSSTATSTTQMSTADNSASYRQETVKDNSHVMKSWQLGLAIALPILGTVILCLIGAYVLKRWKKSDYESSKGVKEDSEPRKSISAQSVDGLTSPTAISTTEV